MMLRHRVHATSKVIADVSTGAKTSSESLKSADVITMDGIITWGQQLKTMGGLPGLIGRTVEKNPILSYMLVSTGEALVSLLDEKGRPGIVERAFIVPPGSRIGPISPEERKALIAASVVAGIYDTVQDRESAYEKLQGQAGGGQLKASPGIALPTDGTGSWSDSIKDTLGGMMSSDGRKDSVFEAMAKSAARTMGSTAGRAIVRGVLGTLLGGNRRR
jgi:hypothetical protein